MTSFWRIWSVSTIICMALLAWRFSGEMTPAAMGQSIATVLLPVGWAIYGLWRGNRSA